MPRFGPDISHFQDRVDLARAKPHVDFVFLKATQGTGFVDGTFRQRWGRLAELEIPRGAYHFAVPSNPPESDAAHFISVVQQHGFRDGDAAILDLEQAKELSARALRAWVDRFVADLRQALPVPGVVFYTNIPFWNERMGGPARLPAGCIGWLARYNKSGPYAKPLGRPSGWPADRPDIWQFTDGTSGRIQAIPGIGGKVDCNEMTEACFQRLFTTSGSDAGRTVQNDLTEEQARQLTAVFEGLTVPGTSGPAETVKLLFDRIASIDAALVVPGTTTAEEAFNLLFARVRNIEDMVEEIRSRI
jgi:GH25 family lysozyme M1 (1,4-beta-N-acetylmuramidase)